MNRRTENERQALLVSGASKLPRPEPGGSYHIDGLGGLFDWIFRMKTRARKARGELEPLLMTEDEMEVWLGEGRREAAGEGVGRTGPS